MGNKTEKARMVIKAAWEYLKYARADGVFEARMVFPGALVLMIVSFIMVHNVIRGLCETDWGLVGMAGIAAVMLWSSIVMLIHAHFKGEAYARAVREEQDEKKYVTELENRLINHDLSKGKGMVLFAPGAEYEAFFIVGRDEYTRNQ